MSAHIRVNGLPLCLAIEDGLVQIGADSRCTVTFTRRANKIAEQLRVLNPEKIITVQSGDCPEMS